MSTVKTVGLMVLMMALLMLVGQWLGQERGGRADLWLGMQMDYDLWQAEQKPMPKVERAPAVV